MNQDSENLQLLSIFFYIIGCLTIVMTCLIMAYSSLYIVMGTFMVQMIGDTMSDGAEAKPAIGTGWLIMLIIMLLLALAVLALGICQIVTGKRISACKSRQFCRTIAGITCALVPFGTILGAFALVILNRPSVIALFEPDTSNTGSILS